MTGVTTNTTSPTFWESVAARAAERAKILAVPCPEPRCTATAGVDCATPNGWATTHKARIRASRGETPATTRRPRPLRLSEAQAERIERAAESGVYYAAGQYGRLRGDATERRCADALEARGLIRQVRTTKSDERVFELTADGWRAYHDDPRVIRRLPDEQHAAICPCRTDQKGDQ